MFSALSSYLWGEQSASLSVLPEAQQINLSCQALVNAKKSLKPAGITPVRDLATGSFLREIQKAKLRLKPASHDE